MPTNHNQQSATAAYWANSNRISDGDVVAATSSPNRKRIWLTIVLVPALVLVGVILAAVIR